MVELTKKEKRILNSLPKEYNLLYRASGTLRVAILGKDDYVYNEKELTKYNGLFQFTKKKGKMFYNIKELLKLKETERVL